MSKSLGNVVTLRNVIDVWGRETLLLYLMSGHYRQPIAFHDDALAAAHGRAEGFREVFRNPSVAADPRAWASFAAALDDDFNTPEALAVLHSWRDHDLLRRALDVFGLASLTEVEQAPPDVVELAKRRHRARSERDFEAADRLRAEIEAAGWEARDVADGFRLVRRR
jgi:cysteinyl-tRNA synthetase